MHHHCCYIISPPLRSQCACLCLLFVLSSFCVSPSHSCRIIHKTTGGCVMDAPPSSQLHRPKLRPTVSFIVTRHHIWSPVCVFFFFLLFSLCFFCQQVKIITARLVKLLLLLLHLLPVFHPNGRAEAYHSASLCRMAVNTNLTWNVRGSVLQVGQEVMARV